MANQEPPIVPHATPPDPPEGWVIVTIPDEIKLPVGDIAERNGWTLKKRSDGRWNACLRESYEHRQTRIFEIEQVIAAKNANNRSAYDRLLAWKGQDAYITPQMRELGGRRLKELAELRTRVAAWETFDLVNLITGD